MFGRCIPQHPAGPARLFAFLHENDRAGELKPDGRWKQKKVGQSVGKLCEGHGLLTTELAFQDKWI